MPSVDHAPSGALQQFAREHLGPIEVVARPNVIGPTRLLHVRARDGKEWFAKRVLTPRQWRAELSAYEVWRDVRGVARLEAHCPRRQCLLLPRIPGSRASGQSAVVRRSAGRVLRRLHAVPPAAGWASDWRTILTSGTDRRLAHLRRSDVAIDDKLVRDHLAELLAYEGSEVATHGDFLPRNWMWDPLRRRVHVLDFGAAGRRPAVYDFSRLRYRTCWHDPGAFQDVLKGYGRRLTSDEERFLVAMLPWRAVVGISMGVHHGWAEVVEHGLDVLRAVGRGESWGAPDVSDQA